MKVEHKVLLGGNGWHVEECADNTVEFQKKSPAGNDIIFHVPAENLAGAAKNYAEAFSVDAYAESHLSERGKPGIPATISGLLEDADAIKAMLNELVDDLYTLTGEEMAESLPHFDFTPNTFYLGSHDDEWTWYLVSNEAELDAVQRWLYCPDCDASGYVPSQYPCWLCFSQTGDGYGAILGTPEEVLKDIRISLSDFEKELDVNCRWLSRDANTDNS